MIQTSILRAQLCLGASLLAVGPALADPAAIESVIAIGQRVDEEGFSDYRVTRSTTGAKADVPNRFIPQSVTVVPLKVLEEQGAATLNDALRNVAGISATNSNMQGAGQWVTSRGFQDRNFYKDGLRDDTFDRSYWLGNVERIEVLKGPASVLYGDGSLGGAINVVSKKPLPETVLSASLWGTGFGGIGGGLDASAKLDAGGRALVRLVADKSHDETYVDRYSFDAQHAALSAQALIGSHTILTFGSEYRSRSADGNMSGLPAYAQSLGLAQSLNLNADWSWRWDTGINVSAALTHEFASGWKANFKVLLNNYDFGQALTSPIYSAAQVATRQVTLSPNKTNSNTQEVITDTNIEGDFTTLGIAHKVVVGVEDSYADIDRLRWGATLAGGTINILAPVTNIAEPGWAENLHIQYLTHRQAGYLQDLISLTSSLKVMAGVRYDDVTRHQNDFRAPASSLKSRYGEWSERAGVTYEILSGVTAFGGYSRSFVPPGDENTTGLGTLPNTEPERGQQFEGGFKLDLGDAFTATAAVYQLKRSNVRTTDTVTQITTIVGAQRSRGFEFDATWKITPEWNLLAAYGYNKAEISGDKRYKVGNSLVNAPENSGRIWTMYEFSSGLLRGVGFGGGVNYVGKRAANLDNTYFSPDYVTADLALTYKLSERYKLSLNANNLFDETYVVASSGDDRPFLYPGDPLNVTVRLQASL